MHYFNLMIFILILGLMSNFGCSRVSTWSSNVLSGVQIRCRVNNPVFSDISFVQNVLDNFEVSVC